MTRTTAKYIKNAYESYKKSNMYRLEDLYGSHSQLKENAFDYCMALCNKLNGHSLKIIGGNCMTFSVGFIGEIVNEKTGEIETCFCYITRDNDRYIPLELI